MSHAVNARVVDTSALPTYLVGARAPVSIDTAGRLVISGSAGGGLPAAGTHTPSDGYANPSDAMNAYALLGGWNGATWDRLRTSINTTSTVSTGVQLSVAASLYNRNPLTGLIWASNCLPLNVDAQTTGGDNSMIAGAFSHGYNGSSWDRLRSDGAGNQRVVRVDPTNLTNAGAGPSCYIHSAVAASAVIKASAARMLSFWLAYDPDDAGVFMLFDDADGPTNGQVPKLQFFGGAAEPITPLIMDRDWLGPSGVAFASGLSWGISSTIGTYTAVAVTGAVTLTATYA